MAKAEGSAINAVKERLAYEVTALVHGKEEADKAQEAARVLFGAGSASANMPSTTVGEDIFAQDAVSVIDLLVLTKLAPSRGEARRLIEQGGIAVDDVKVTSLTESVKKPPLIKAMWS